jgi:hypothetical protein
LSACGDDAVAPEADVPIIDPDTASDAGDTTTPDSSAPDAVGDVSVPDTVEDTAPDSDDTLSVIDRAYGAYDAFTAEQRAVLDLSTWKVAFIGAEAVDPATLARFAEGAVVREGRVESKGKFVHSADLHVTERAASGG